MHKQLTAPKVRRQSLSIFALFSIENCLTVRLKSVIMGAIDVQAKKLDHKRPWQI